MELFKDIHLIRGEASRTFTFLKVPTLHSNYNNTGGTCDACIHLKSRSHPKLISSMTATLKYTTVQYNKTSRSNKVTSINKVTTTSILLRRFLIPVEITISHNDFSKRLN